MGEEQRKIPMHSKASLVKGQIWSPVAAAGEKNHKCLFTDSLHRLGSRFARTSSVSLEKILLLNKMTVGKCDFFEN